MKKQNAKGFLCILLGIIALFAIAVYAINTVLTDFIEKTNLVLANQKFTSVDEAIESLEKYEYDNKNTSLDICPPYDIFYTFEYEENTIVLLSYCLSFDGEKSKDYYVRVLKHNEDDTISFDCGNATFIMEELDTEQEYYYFTNINTGQGKKSISLLYLPADSDKDVYVDNVKAEKIHIQTEEEDFYLCYAISSRDTFIKNLILPISKRHKVETR